MNTTEDNLVYPPPKARIYDAVRISLTLAAASLLKSIIWNMCHTAWQRQSPAQGPSLTSRMGESQRSWVLHLPHFTGLFLSTLCAYLLPPLWDFSSLSDPILRNKQNKTNNKQKNQAVLTLCVHNWKPHVSHLTSFNPGLGSLFSLLHPGEYKTNQQHPSKELLSPI